jgi:tetratricopeptide (TPR) repeat protein/predicted Ser/Thr protein kinase
MSTDPLDRVKRFFGEAPEEGGASRSRAGKYQILREIARGGMAVVYEALDPDLNRRVALKILKEGNLERLRREAAAAAKLRHPNVVAIHEVGPEFIAMELVPGRTLAEALPGLEQKERIRILHAIAGAVAYAHTQGVIHRDLKPSNVIVEPGGRPVLTDFGLAKIEGGEDLTRTGAVAGTPHSMAPEQVRGELKRIGPPTDVWALGVLLYEMIADRKPFQGETALAIYEKITRDDPPRIAGDLGTIAAKALEKDPERRYPDGAAMAEDLRRYLMEEPISARPVGLLERAWKRVRRNPAVSALGAGVVLALAAAMALGWIGRLERMRALEALRQNARVSLDAALELRRAGANARMRQFLPPLESAYREALERAPGMAEVEYLMGRMHRALLEEGKAKEFQDRALSKDPRYAPALYERAVILSMDYGRALKGAEEERSPRDAAPELGPLRESILRDCEGFLGVSDMLSGAASISVIRGIRSYHRGDHADARVSLEEAIKIDPFLEEARETLTQVVRAELRPGLEDQERRWRQAEELYTQGLARDRGYLPHFLGRGELRWSRGSARRHRGLDPLPDYGAAVDDFTEALRLAPSAPEPWTWRGQLRMYHAIWRIETGQDPRPDCSAAEEDLTKAIALNATHARAWMWRGNTRFYRATWLVERGQDPLAEFEASEKDLSEAVRLAGDWPDPLKWRGRSRAQHAGALGRRGKDPSALFDAAEQDFARLEKVLATDTWMWTWRSTVGSERGIYKRSTGADPRADFAKAEEQINEALRLNRYLMEGWKHRGFLRLARAQYLEGANDKAGAKKSYADAAADFLEALSINPNLKHQIGDRMERARQKAAELDNP